MIIAINNYNVTNKIIIQRNMKVSFLNIISKIIMTGYNIILVNYFNILKRTILI